MCSAPIPIPYILPVTGDGYSYYSVIYHVMFAIFSNDNETTGSDQKISSVIWLQDRWIELENRHLVDWSIPVLGFNKMTKMHNAYIQADAGLEVQLMFTSDVRIEENGIHCAIVGGLCVCRCSGTRMGNRFCFLNRNGFVNDGGPSRTVTQINHCRRASQDIQHVRPWDRWASQGPSQENMITQSGQRLKWRVFGGAFLLKNAVSEIPKTIQSGIHSHAWGHRGHISSPTLMLDMNITWSSWCASAWFDTLTCCDVFGRIGRSLPVWVLQLKWNV